MSTKTIPATAAAEFERDGVYFAQHVIPHDLIERAAARMDAVIAGEYETGTQPHMRHFSESDPPEKVRKIDDAHLADRTIFEVISHPSLGRWAAAVTGANMIQVWGTQLLVKPTNPTQKAKSGNIGWHQDMQYWQDWWDGEAFTAWIAVSDVTPNAGPVRFARGSHAWGFLNQGDFWETEIEEQGNQIGRERDWEEVPAILAPGGVSFHHRYTFHASGPNLEPFPRRSFAVHMRTEKCTAKPGQYYTSNLDNMNHCPIIYQA